MRRSPRPAVPPGFRHLSRRLAFVAATMFLIGLPAEAQPPGDVGSTLGVSSDQRTISWGPVPGATGYNVYRGSVPAAADHACLIVHTASTTAEDRTVPASPGGSFYYLVSAVNAAGEGTLGTASDGTPRLNPSPCLDADLDLVADNLDNCPAAANAGQADQDLNAVGDACDPNTYDFQADSPGQRPSGMTQLGGADPTFTVKDLGGDLAVSYSESASGVHDRFERLMAGMPLQDVTVYLDVAPGAETCSIELWSEGAYGWNAGGGVILQVGSSGSLTFYDRAGQSVPAIPGPAAPADGRLRIRLIKGAGNASTMHVDSWDGSAWQPDHAVFPVADDHRYRGLGTVLANYLGGRRGVLRVTIAHEVPPGALILRKDPSWSSDWKLFQRDSQGQASIPLRFYYRLDSPGSAQARVVSSSTGGALPGYDWLDHAVSLAAADPGAGSLDLPGVPAGGNYDIEVRLLRDSDGAVLGQAALAQVAVGDVFLAGGQSNMSGYSGDMLNAETPVDEVHVFHNDYTWRRASEPMDDGTDQVDRVSYETPLHTLMLRFAKEIFQATGVPVAIIPGPLGGTNLYSQWQRDASSHANRGTLYGSLLHRALLQSYAHPIKGFLWYQGESDAGRGTASYKADLKRLMEQYREDLDNPSLFFGIVQLATYDFANVSDWLQIQEAQRQVVEEDPLSVLSAAVDLPRSDSIHLNVEGYKTIGSRLAREMRERLYGEGIDASARLVEVRAGGHGSSVELVYDADVSGGAPNLYQIADDSGIRAIGAVTVSGNVVTLALQGRLKPNARVSYGMSRSPTLPWVKDAGGTAVACFHSLPVPP